VFPCQTLKFRKKQTETGAPVRGEARASPPCGQQSPNSDDSKAESSACQ